jgi:hypothetical protein
MTWLILSRSFYCVFRTKLVTDSGANWTRIPA